MTILKSDDRLFDHCVELVLASEGGMVDHPADPGKVTFRGVSHLAVVGLRGENGEFEFDLDGDGDVDVDDFKRLAELWQRGDTEKIVGFYRKRYWLASRANEMRWPLCYLLFDAAVNHGVKPALVMLQNALGVPADGVMGSQTINASNARPAMETLKRYLVKRARLYHEISVKRGPVFFDGWMRRLFDVQQESLRRV